jgi:hypothetical protein
MILPAGFLMVPDSAGFLGCTSVRIELEEHGSQQSCTSKGMELFWPMLSLDSEVEQRCSCGDALRWSVYGRFCQYALIFGILLWLAIVSYYASCTSCATLMSAKFEFTNVPPQNSKEEPCAESRRTLASKEARPTPTKILKNLFIPPANLSGRLAARLWLRQEGTISLGWLGNDVF